MPRNAKQIDETPEVSATPEDAVDTAMLTTAPDDWEFETVTDETPTRISFDTFGESVILQYVEQIHVDQEPDKEGKDRSFDLLIWKGRDGKPYSLNVSYKLKQAMETVVPGDWCRLTYIKDVPTARNMNPMQDIKVERRLPALRPSTAS